MGEKTRWGNVHVGEADEGVAVPNSISVVKVVRSVFLGDERFLVNVYADGFLVWSFDKYSGMKSLNWHNDGSCTENGFREARGKVMEEVESLGTARSRDSGTHKFLNRPRL